MATRPGCPAEVNRAASRRRAAPRRFPTRELHTSSGSGAADHRFHLDFDQVFLADQIRVGESASRRTGAKNSRGLWPRPPNRPRFHMDPGSHHLIETAAERLDRGADLLQRESRLGLRVADCHRPSGPVGGGSERGCGRPPWSPGSSRIRSPTRPHCRLVNVSFGRPSSRLGPGALRDLATFPGQ